jgi:NIMA-interacting peptidyl-prolyl cis-trans isomerase 1
MTLLPKHAFEFSIVHLAIACGVTASLGCSRFREGPAPVPSGSAAVARVPSYPHARWRLASPADLGRTVLWVSHIVVMHRDSAPAISGLRALDWAPDTIQSRSADEAMRRARELAQRARSNPAAFADLARESDDTVTRAGGGSLGPLAATSLPAAFLDALAVLPPGDVSDVITTPLGYHIIQRRVAPPLDVVAGQRVVIRYTTTFGSGPSTRSRADALALSLRIIAEAKAGADFTALVKKYSEGLDRERGGDMGISTTLEPGIHSRLIEALAQVAPGDLLLEPVETSWGFEIAKRVPVTAHQEFAARVVRVSFDPSSPSAEADAHREAKVLADAARRNPAAIALSGSVEPIRWFDGKGDPVLTNIVESLAVGEHTKAPVRLHDAFAVVERVTPDTFCGSRSSLFELPAPTWVDIDELIRVNRGEILVSAAKELRALVPVLHLSAGEARELAGTLDRIHADFGAATSPDERVVAYRRSAGSLKKKVSESSYALIISAIQEWLGARLINPPTELQTG